MDDSSRYVLTLTPNPALDLFLGVERMTPDTMHRAESEHRRAGGKGLNVARVLGLLGVRARAIVAVGGGAGEEVVARARVEQLDVVPVRVSFDTRINVVVEDAKSHRLKVNMAGGPATPADMRVLADVTCDHVNEASALVIAGALAPGMELGVLADVVRFVSKRGIPVFVDAEGAMARKLVTAGASVLKINRAEFSEFVGRQVDDAALAPTMEEFRRRYALQIIAITQGARGAALEDEKGYCDQNIPGGNIARRLVGGGDAFLAGLVAGYLRQERNGRLLGCALDAAALWADKEGFR